MSTTTNQASGVAEPDDERAKFEATIGKGRNLERTSSGDYVLMYVQNDWEVWQARAALATKPAAPAEVVPGDALKKYRLTWQEAEEICVRDEVDEALREFVHDSTGDNAIGLARCIVETWLRHPAQAPSTGAVSVEAVATVVRKDGELDLDWLIEGGISAMVEGETLMICAERLTDDTGSGEVYLAPPVVQPASPAVEVAKDRWNEPGVQTVHAQICCFGKPAMGHDIQVLSERIIDTLRARGWTPPAPAAVTEGARGWKWMPPEPIKAMLDAVIEEDGEPVRVSRFGFVDAYKAMFAAHPAVAVPGSLTDEQIEAGALAAGCDSYATGPFERGARFAEKHFRALATTSTAAQPAECSDCKRREVYKTWPHRRPGCTQCAES